MWGELSLLRLSKALVLLICKQDSKDLYKVVLTIKMNYSARSKQIQRKQRPMGPGLAETRNKFPRTLSHRTCSALLWEVLSTKRSPGKDSVTKVFFFSFQEVWVKEHVKIPGLQKENTKLHGIQVVCV